MSNTALHQDSSPTVLLVEDNLVDAEWALRALKDPNRNQRYPNIDVVHVDRLHTALARLEDDGVHLIVLDLGLPDAEDDLASVEQILSLSPDIPIIVYSGSTYEQHGLAALERGALFFFPKSSNDQSWFVNTVQRALERHQLQENLRRIIEKSEDGMAIYTTAGDLTFANPAARRMLGLSPSEMGYNAPFPLDRETEVAVSDNRTAELRLVELEWNGKQAILATLRDITNRLNLERQLRHSQKMEAIGLLASGLAHDLNNVLTIVSGYTNIVMETLPEPSASREDLNEIQLAGERATTLIRRLLKLSADDSDSPHPVSPDQIIKAVHSLLARLIGADVQLEMDTNCRSHLVLADPAQLEQAIINLAINARDAMPNGGKLTISTTFVSEAPIPISEEIQGDKHSGHILLEVKDTGHGMDEEVLNRAFEPFFTTKGIERGTGLGLATTYRIVKQCGGSIAVESAPERGTNFRLYLPCTNLRAVDTATPQLSSEIAGGNETILLVEDEPAVRRLAVQILKARGYHVLDAGDSQSALEEAETVPAIDLLVTDLVMPGMNGVQLADKLRERNPSLKTLLVSGYSEDAVRERGILASSNAFLQKPFSPRALTKIVRDALDAT